MPKDIDVKLVGISGDFTKAVPGGELAVTGRLFGVIFDEVPDEVKDFFTFPDGAIAVRHQQQQSIDRTATFSLRNPSQDPPGIFGTSLRFGGILIVAESGALFEEKFDTITTFTHTQVGQEHDHVLRFINGNQELRVDFVVTVVNST